jgi:hypothetical protein
VASALRDLPYGTEHQPENPDLRVGRSTSSVTVPEPTPGLSPTLLAASSHSTVASFFQILLCMHLFSVLEPIDNDSSESRSSVSSMMQIMQSLFTMLQKVKSKFQSTPETAGLGHDHFDVFIKKNLDMFDESCITESQVSIKQDDVEDDAALGLDPSHSDVHESEEDGFEGDQGGLN